MTCFGGDQTHTTLLYGVNFILVRAAHTFTGEPAHPPWLKAACVMAQVCEITLSSTMSLSHTLQLQGANGHPDRQPCELMLPQKLLGCSHIYFSG